MKYVVIAEKPSVARELATFLKANNKKPGYLEGGDYAVTWAFGHLITIATPDVHGFVSWSKESLPMLPEKFILEPKKEMKNGKPETDEGVIKQLKIIKSLFNQCESIIVATDAGREGELIFRYIYEYLECRKPFKRLWISSQTNKAIKEGFENLLTGNDFDDLFYSAKSRSEADWLVGLNATQALTLAINQRGVYSLGRVQTPTLALICKRYLENKNFKPVDYFQVKTTNEKDNIEFNCISIDNYESVEPAKALMESIKARGSINIVKIDKKTIAEQPPLLFDLTALQQEANKKFSLSADDTLQYAQTLYEKKFITYPRTGSRYIGDDVFATIPELLENAKQFRNYKSLIDELLQISLNKKSVNGEKVTDHHALLITENLPGQNELNDNEHKIYELIFSRMLEAFNKPCIKNATKILFTSGVDENGDLKASGTVIEFAGWRKIRSEDESLTNEESDKNPDLSQNKHLPALAEGEVLKIKDVAVLGLKTKPKPLLTDASLLQAMETCGKDIQDEEAREAMKDSGLGTPATRASIIKILFTRGYIDKKGKALIPTQKGLAIYEIIKDKAIAQVALTGAWEKMLSLISKGEFDASKFLKGVERYTTDITKELLELGQSVVINDLPKLQCPKCKKGIINFHEKLASCSLQKEGCDFKVWKTIADKKLSDDVIIKLIATHKTPEIKGFKTKEGKSFSASLILDETGAIKFADKPKKKK